MILIIIALQLAVATSVGGDGPMAYVCNNYGIWL